MKEKNCVNNLIEVNNYSKNYNDIFSSLQILMKEIVNENYNYNYLLYNVIEKFPKYIKINEELIKMFKINQYQNRQKYFTLMTLVPIYEYFEKLCWEEIKKNVLLDYQIKIDEKIKKHILKYFDDNENKNKKDLIISKKDFALAIRKFISRYLASLSGEIDQQKN